MSDDQERPFACEQCFADQVLVEWIRENGRIGECSWCGATSVYVIPIVVLAPHFRDVAKMYEECHDGGGDSLAALLQGDWNVFSDRIVGEEEIVYGNELLDDMVEVILHAGLTAKEIYGEANYTGMFRFGGYPSTLESEWEERVAELFEPSAELRARPSSFPEGSPLSSPEPVGPAEGSSVAPSEWPDVTMEPMPAELEVDRLEFAIEDMGASYTPQQTLYRARIHDDPTLHEKYGPEDMGAPPAERVLRGGRANRLGQSVLYMASDAATALAEVRVWKGAIVAVAEMQLPMEVRVLDLIDVRNLRSPFFVEGLRWRVEVLDLLGRFAYELSRPLLPNEPEDHYAPTQHLCELVQHAGYEGIAYPSAMGLGHNLVLFDPSAAQATLVKYLEVREVSFKTDPFTAANVYLDAWSWKDD